mmetsp:Transcript_18827/g.47528  ORF Transcript_18827/g.47528 Transcript_18827/m.47528 type:complete len:284 (+) Transcript_18827:711-1562(+)
MKRYSCRRVSTVVYLDATSTFTGLFRHARCSLATLLVIVAEKSCVRRSLGMTFRIWSISSSKSMFSRRSASSRMKCRSARRLKPLVFARWSTTRPGVPTMMCGRLASAMACAIMSTPPTSAAHLTPMVLPSASNCSPIWMASSRVGDSTRQNSACGLSSSSCSTGSAKAPVLPDPVCASPMMSLPCRSCGMACSWMAEGFFQPSPAAASASCECTPSLRNSATATAVSFSDSADLFMMLPPSPLEYSSGALSEARARPDSGEGQFRPCRSARRNCCPCAACTL